MRTGRPSKPIALKRLEGDTRQRGSNKHAESVTTAFEARRGEPEMPAALRSRKGDTPRARLVLKSAREHWKYLMREMAADGLLAIVDQGIITDLCLAFGAMVETGRAGEVGDFAKAAAEYRMSADRACLSEIARAKVPRQKTDQVDPMEAAICA